MEDSTKNHVLLGATIVNSALLIYSGLSFDLFTAFLALISEVLLIVLVSNSKPPRFFIDSFTELYHMWACGSDGMEFGAMQVNAIPPDGWQYETLKDTDEHPYRFYYIKNHMQMIDLVVLNPWMTSPRSCPSNDFLRTTIEFRNIGQFRTYMKRKLTGGTTSDIKDFLKNVDEEEFKRLLKNKAASAK